MAMPISSQPMPMTMMTGVGLNLNTPGVGILNKLNSVQIKEERTATECLCGDKIPCGGFSFFGCGPPKKHYTLAHPDNEDSKILLMKEENSFCTRRSCTRMRDFTTRAFDYNTKQEIFRVVRDFEFCPCYCNYSYPTGLCGYYGEICTDGFRVKVESNLGVTMGYVEQQTSCCALEFHILNNARLAVYKFRATMFDGCCSNPCCVFPFCVPPICRWVMGCPDVVATLTNVHGAEVGAIRFQYPGCVEAFFCWQHQFRIDCEFLCDKVDVDLN